MPFFRKASKIGGKSDELRKKIERTKGSLKDHQIAEQADRKLLWVVGQRQRELKSLRKDIPELGCNAGGICKPWSRWVGRIDTRYGGGNTTTAIKLHRQLVRLDTQLPKKLQYCYIITDFPYSWVLGACKC